MSIVMMKESIGREHCEHEYANDNTWKCEKCGHQILPDIIGKIAKIGSGKIRSTNV
ncbi:MAG: hypothetical protein ABSF63_03565 [Candidatus Bathyarchaeia archaeon]